MWLITGLRYRSVCPRVSHGVQRAVRRRCRISKDLTRPLLANIPFLELPQLLLSAIDLVYRLWDVPKSSFVPPEAIVTFMSTMTSLNTFHFKVPFSSVSSRHRRLLSPSHLPLIMRAVHPTHPSTHLCFQGKSEYLDDLVPHVTVTLLDIMPSNRLVFDGTLAPATDKTYMEFNGAPD